MVAIIILSTPRHVYTQYSILSKNNSDFYVLLPLLFNVSFVGRQWVALLHPSILCTTNNSNLIDMDKAIQVLAKESL
jgi:hypothetical protein